MKIAGILLGIELLKRKKYKTFLIIEGLFFLVGLIMFISSFVYQKNFKYLEENGIIVSATVYNLDRISITGEKHNQRYYEWIYNGQYYSSVIPSYDPIRLQDEAIGHNYDIYIDPNEPSNFTSVVR